MQQGFGIAGGMPRPIEALTQLLVVVDLAVVGKHQRAQHHGLRPCRGRILDGEPPVPQCGSRRGPNALAVRATMPQALRHGLDCVAARARSDDTDYAAHGRQSSATSGLPCTASHPAALRLGCVLERIYGNTSRSTPAGTTGEMAHESGAPCEVLFAGRRQLLQDTTLAGTSTSEPLDH